MIYLQNLSFATLVKPVLMQVALFGITTALGTVVAPQPSTALTITAPNNQETVEGDLNNAFPFNIAPFGKDSQRYQQVFAASQFSTLTGSDFINQIRFRPDALFEEGGLFSATLPKVQINLSTTSKAPDGLSSIFVENVGTDDTVVFSGPLSLSSAFTGPANGPKDFDILINLMTPFQYNPSLGNLLLDVRNFGGGTTTFFDAVATSGDSVSRVYTPDVKGVNSETGTQDSIGLVTQFGTTPVATPVPEPSLLLGLIGMGVAALRKRQGARSEVVTAQEEMKN